MISLNEFLINKKINITQHLYDVYKFSLDGYSWYNVKVDSEKELDYLIKNSGIKLSQDKKMLADIFFDKNKPLFIKPSKRGGTNWQEDFTDVDVKDMNINISAKDFNYDYWKQNKWE